MNNGTEEPKQQTVQFLLRVEEGLKRSVEKWADNEKRSTNQQAIQMLEEAIAKREQEAEL